MKMNRNIILFSILSILALIAYFLMPEKQEHPGMDTSDREFAVRNAEDIGSIHLMRKDFPALVFARDQGYWVINRSIPVSEYTFPSFLETITKVRLAFIPPRSAAPTIMERINKNGIHIKVFDKKNELLRSYFVGNESPDGRATYYLMEGSNIPYAMEIPGFDGSLRNRMIYNLDQWRSKNIFKENMQQIASVAIEFIKDPESSFKIERKKNNYLIQQTHSVLKRPARAMNQSVAEAYLANFERVIAEANENENPNKEFILEHQPFAKIIVTRLDGTQRDIVLINMDEMVNEGVSIDKWEDIHPDSRFFVKYPNDELMLVQAKAIVKVLRTFKHLTTNPMELEL
jgi:hypothetical protein